MSRSSAGEPYTVCKKRSIASASTVGNASVCANQRQLHIHSLRIAYQVPCRHRQALCLLGPRRDKVVAARGNDAPVRPDLAVPRKDPHVGVVERRPKAGKVGAQRVGVRLHVGERVRHLLGLHREDLGKLEVQLAVLARERRHFGLAQNDRETNKKVRKSKQK